MYRREKFATINTFEKQSGVLYKDTILEVTVKYYNIIQHLTKLRKTSKDYFPARMTSQKYAHHPFLELYNSCISALSLKE